MRIFLSENAYNTPINQIRTDPGKGEIKIAGFAKGF